MFIYFVLPSAVVVGQKGFDIMKSKFGLVSLGPVKVLDVYRSKVILLRV
jgi:hypothetical protein